MLHYVSSLGLLSLGRILLMTTPREIGSGIVYMYLECGERKSSHLHQTTNAVAVTNPVVRSHLLEFSPCVAFLTSFLSAQTSRRKAARDRFSIQALAMVQIVLLSSAGLHTESAQTGHQLV